MPDHAQVRHHRPDCRTGDIVCARKEVARGAQDRPSAPARVLGFSLAERDGAHRGEPCRASPPEAGSQEACSCRDPRRNGIAGDALRGAPCGYRVIARSARVLPRAACGQGRPGVPRLLELESAVHHLEAALAPAGWGQWRPQLSPLNVSEESRRAQKKATVDFCISLQFVAVVRSHSRRLSSLKRS